MAQLRRGSYHTAPPILALATARASLGADFSAFQGHVRRQPPKTAAGTERAGNAARGANPTSHRRNFRWMRTLCLPSARTGPPGSSSGVVSRRVQAPGKSSPSGPLSRSMRFGGRPNSRTWPGSAGCWGVGRPGTGPPQNSTSAAWRRTVFWGVGPYAKSTSAVSRAYPWKKGVAPEQQILHLMYAENPDELAHVRREVGRGEAVHFGRMGRQIP